MKSFRFTKMHGLGNNYIYVNAFEENLEENQLANIAIEVSNVYTGIGSDGLILICPSKKAPVKMRIFNADGSEAKNCGNGLRCVAKYAYEHGLVTNTTFLIETISVIVEATVHVQDGVVEEVTINMGKPIFTKSLIPYAGPEELDIIKGSINFEGNQYSFTSLSMGNPHAVIEVDSINKAPLRTLGPVLEKHAFFPEGVNVEFIERCHSTEMHFRVWERGSGVTQACGTGACAAAVTTVIHGKAPRNEEITVHLEGGDLHITVTDDDTIYMRGAATTIAEGIYYLK